MQFVYLFDILDILDIDWVSPFRVFYVVYRIQLFSVKLKEINQLLVVKEWLFEDSKSFFEK